MGVKVDEKVIVRDVIFVAIVLVALFCAGYARGGEIKIPQWEGEATIVAASWDKPMRVRVTSEIGMSWVDTCNAYSVRQNGSRVLTNKDGMVAEYPSSFGVQVLK